MSKPTLIEIKYWYKDFKLHREDGPAVLYPNGYESWYLNGKQHRIDGPARIWDNDRCPPEWYINGEFIPVKSQKEFEQYKKLIAFI
jgi:hypothetical protein